MNTCRLAEQTYYSGIGSGKKIEGRSGYQTTFLAGLDVRTASDVAQAGMVDDIG